MVSCQAGGTGFRFQTRLHTPLKMFILIIFQTWSHTQSLPRPAGQIAVYKNWFTSALRWLYFHHSYFFFQEIFHLRKLD